MTVRISNGKRALVIGCGASGLAAATYFDSRGWAVTVVDSRENPAGADTLRKTLPRVRFSGGALPAHLADDADIVMISPGLSPHNAPACELVARAKARGVEVVGEIELFARELRRLRSYRNYHPKIVGITGTNGKTTTTTIVGLMVQEAGLSVCVAGNIGPNALTELEKHLLANTLPDVWVLELSSFQLETTSSLHCDAAAFLNLTQDHVDWHGSMAGYESAKRRIFSDTTVRVLNRDDAATMRAACEGSICTSFGQDAPTIPGTWGVVEEGGMRWLSMMPQAEPAVGKKAILAAEPPQLKLLMPAGALKIRGRHNAMNALAALALATAVGVPLAKALAVLTVYRGEAHRVQFVLETKGIEFIDDSKGTNVGATVAALEGLGADGRRSSIILGGDGKGQDFAPIAQAIAKYACHVVLIGRDAPLIAEALKNISVEIELAGTDFEKAVDMAYSAAKPGDVVLLSPACASWDMFANYAERSARFVARARCIAADNGSIVP